MQENARWIGESYIEGETWIGRVPELSSEMIFYYFFAPRGNSKNFERIKQSSFNKCAGEDYEAVYEIVNAVVAPFIGSTRSHNSNWLLSKFKSRQSSNSLS